MSTDALETRESKLEYEDLIDFVDLEVLIDIQTWDDNWVSQHCFRVSSVKNETYSGILRCRGELYFLETYDKRVFIIDKSNFRAVNIRLNTSRKCESATDATGVLPKNPFEKSLELKRMLDLLRALQS